jgi:hypothetical protein
MHYAVFFDLSLGMINHECHCKSGINWINEVWHFHELIGYNLFTL